MAFGVKLLTFTKPTTGTPPVNQVSGSLGFTPKGAIAFHCNGHNTGSTTSYTEHVGWGVGFSDGTNHRCMSSMSADNAGSAIAKNVSRNAFISINDNTAMDDEADVSFQSDTITLIWNTRSANAGHIFVLVFGGSDVTNVTVGDFSSPIVAGNQTTSGTSFTPDCELYMVSSSASNDTAIVNGGPWNLGFAISSSKQFSASSSSEDGRATMDTQHITRTDACITQNNLSVANDEYIIGGFNAFTSTGRTITWESTVAGAANEKVYFMAIKGAQVDVGSFNVTAGTGNFSPVTGMAFQPQAWLFVGTGAAANEAITVAHNRCGIGAAVSSSERGCISFHDTDAAGTSINTKTHQTTQCMRLHTANATAGSSVTELALDFVSNDSGGCTLNRVTNTTVLGNELIGWFAIGASAAAGNNITRSLATETVSISESSLTKLKGSIRTRSETVTVSESRARLAAKNRAPGTQTIALSESVVRVKGKIKTLATETIMVTGGTLARLAAKIRTRNETVTISESGTPSRIKGAIRALATQTIGIGAGTIATQKGKLRALATQTVAISENLARLCTLTRIIPQTITISDNRARIKGAIRSLALQSIALSENIATQKGKLRALATQTVAVSEASLARIKGANRTLATQNVAVGGGTLARLKASLRTIPQTVIIGEVIVRVKGKVKALSPQTVVITENLAKQMAKIRSVSQSVILSDAVERVIAGANDVVRTISQTVVVTGGTLTRLTVKTRTLSETTTITGPLTRIKSSNRTLSDTKTVGAGTVVRIKGKVKAISETIIITENLTRRLTQIRTIIQSVNIIAPVTRVKSANRMLSDSKSISDSLLKVKASIKNVTQSTAINETLTRLLSQTRTISQTITIADNVQHFINILQQNIIRTATDTIAILETLQAYVVKVSERFRRIRDPSQRKIKSNHPAWLLGTRGMHDDYEEFSP